MSALAFYSLQNMKTIRSTVMEQAKVPINASSMLFQDAMVTTFRKCVQPGIPGGPALVHRMNEMVVNLLTHALAPQRSGGRGNSVGSNFAAARQDNALAQATYLPNRNTKNAISQQHSKLFLKKISSRLQGRRGNIMAPEPIV